MAKQEDDPNSVTREALDAAQMALGNLEVALQMSRAAQNYETRGRELAAISEFADGVGTAVLNVEAALQLYGLLRKAKKTGKEGVL